MPMDGMPMPLAWTETFAPFQSPVKPWTPRTLLTSLASVRKFSAIYFERSGSPGMRTVFAKSPLTALLWGVGMVITSV